MTKPRQSRMGLWNISFGFFGIQIGFALQNANVSRIFQSLGTSIDDLPILWIAGPAMLVVGLVGHRSIAGRIKAWGASGSFAARWASRANSASLSVSMGLMGCSVVGGICDRAAWHHGNT